MKPLLLTLLACSIGATAQAQDIDSTNLLDKFTQDLASKCEQNTDEMLNKENNKPAFRNRPVNTASICSCTNEKLVADQKLRSMFIGAKDEVEARLTDGTIGSYLSVRVMQAGFECMSIDLNKSLLAFTLAPRKAN